VDRAVRLLQDQAAGLGPDRPAPENDAKAIAAWIGDRVPLVWGSEGLGEAAALRWKTQLNENAKVPAFAAVLPELGHNEIEGWSGGAGPPFALVVLRFKGEHPRVAPRVAATIELIRPSGLEVREVHARGTRPLEVLLSLVMTGDFVSTYLGVLRGVDPLEIPVLTDLKRRLRG
jgi:glucose/mannose-6-phosphate isomerase